MLSFHSVLDLPFSFCYHSSLYLSTEIYTKYIWRVKGPGPSSGHYLSTIQPPSCPTLFQEQHICEAIALTSHMIAAPSGAVVSVNVALHQAACSNVVVGDRASAFDVCQDSACVFAARVQTPLVLVSLHVQGEVVRSGKGARADGALEGLGARVLPVMARQLIRTGETPVAAVPRAPVRLLT